MISKKIEELLKSREFVSVATCGPGGRPNAAPKFLLKAKENFIYLIDYAFGQTWENIKINPRVSISFVDTDTLRGYQINGAVEIIEKGPVYDAILKELLQKAIDLSAKRIVEGVVKGKVHEAFEVAIPEKFIIFKVKIAEAVEIGARGEIKREKVC